MMFVCAIGETTTYISTLGVEVERLKPFEARVLTME